MWWVVLRVPRENSSIDIFYGANMAFKPVFMALSIAVSLYLVTWLMIPSRASRCEHCQGRMHRFRRKKWQRMLSLLFPLCNMKCGGCSRQATRRMYPSPRKPGPT